MGWNYLDCAEVTGESVRLELVEVFAGDGGRVGRET